MYVRRDRHFPFNVDVGSLRCYCFPPSHIGLPYVSTAATAPPPPQSSLSLSLLAARQLPLLSGAKDGGGERLECGALLTNLYINRFYAPPRTLT